LSEATRPREFIPVDDAAEAKGLLREGAKSVAATLMWTRNQEHVLNTHLNMYSEAEGTFYVWVPREFDAEKFVDETIKLEIKDCFFSVSLARANIFFKAEFLGHDSGGLKFRFPEKIFKVQRRRDLRFPIPEGHVVKVEYQDPIFTETRLTKKILNISAGGLGVLIQDEEKIHYHPGMTLTRLEFTLRQRKIACEAEVRHIKSLPADHRYAPGAQMGLLFQKIKKGDADWIASYVFEESRKYYTKYL
jgi:hypothetical protein